MALLAAGLSVVFAFQNDLYNQQPMGVVALSDSKSSPMVLI